MTLPELMRQNNMSMYKLSKNSHIPYTTLNDIVSGKTRLQKCSAETVYRLSRELGVSMEALLEPCMEQRCSFELFKSNVCHRLKVLGDIPFIAEILERDDITAYYQKKWYPECLYLLAMLDYVSRENDVPLCRDYNELRKMKLSSTLFPSSVLTAASVAGNDRIKEKAEREAIPEFLRFNIVESEVRDVN